MIREHLRSHVIAYVALFVALSGTAIADHPGGADTISTEDIINGEVRTNDISNSNGVRSADVRDDTEADGGLAAVDLAANSVGASEIGSEEVTTIDIKQDGVVAADIGTSAVGSSEIATDAVGGSELAPNSVLSSEIASNAILDVDLAGNSVGGDELKDNAVGGPEIATGAVGGSEIASASVGGEELGPVIERRSPLVSVSDGTAHDGAYGKSSATVSCQPGEVLLNVSVDWLTDADHNETALADEELEYFSNEQTATVSGAFDGGDVASFQAVAACLTG